MAESLGAEELIHRDGTSTTSGSCASRFTAFWGYITFGQFLVIWYGNMPEETHFFFLRMSQPWVTLTVSVARVDVRAARSSDCFGKYREDLHADDDALRAVLDHRALAAALRRDLSVDLSTSAGEHAAGSRADRRRGTAHLPFGLYEIGVTLGFLGLWGFCYLAFMNAFPRMRVFMMTSPYRDEVQVPVNPKTMEPLPAHE